MTPIKSTPRQRNRKQKREHFFQPSTPQATTKEIGEKNNPEVKKRIRKRREKRGKMGSGISRKIRDITVITVLKKKSVI